MVEKQLHQYVFVGKILPERAFLSFGTQDQVQHLKTQRMLEIRSSIVLNQVWVTVWSTESWDRFDLRNIVVSYLEDVVSRLALLMGHAYDVEITRVVGEIDDWVFGIDNPTIESNLNPQQLSESFTRLSAKLGGEFNYLISRALKDLRLALKDSNDCGFYCYRAIESLKKHAAASSETNKNEWEIFRAAAKVERASIDAVKVFADEPRHGGIVQMTDEQRAALLKTTWAIVNSYIEQLPAAVVQSG